MNRRKYLGIAGVLVSGLAGCSGSSNPDGDRSTPPESERSTPATTQLDTGVVMDRNLSNLRERIQTVQAGQRVLVEVSGIAEGEMLLFKVGDGTGFVYSDRFYDDRSGSYTFESDGRHQLLFSPERHEVPVNEDVSVNVLARIESA